MTDQKSAFSTNTSSLVGTWRLESAEFTGSDGSISYPYGESPVGIVTYDAGGHMSVQLMREERAHFDSNDPTMGNADEIRAAFEGIITYFGAYLVDEGLHRVTHRLEGCSFPNWEGTELSRHYAIEGDLLTLTTDPMQVGGTGITGVLVWRRIA